MAGAVIDPADVPADALKAFAAASPASAPPVEGAGQTLDVADLPPDVAQAVLPPKQLRDYLDRRQYGDVSAQARAAGEAALRGLSLGLSDAALVKLGFDPEGLRKRQEQNPITSRAFELGGAAAPILLSGGGAAPVEGASLARVLGGVGADAVRAAGAVPRAVAAAGRATEGGLSAILGGGVAARGVARGVAGVAEGGLYGLGQAVSEAALQDVPLTSERVIAHMGMGALFGGAIGGALGTAAASVDAHLIPQVKKLFNVESLQGMVDRAGLRQWAQGRGKAMFGRLRKDFGSDAEATIGRVVRDEGLDKVIASGSTWDDIHAATKDRLGVAGRKIGDDLRAIDEALPDEAAGAAQKIAGRATDEILEPLRSSGIRSDKALANKMQRDLQWLWQDENEVRAAVLAERPKLEGAALDRAVQDRMAQAQAEFVPSFERLHQLRGRIDDLAFPKSYAAEPTEYQKALQKLRGIVEDEITKGADTAVGTLGDVNLTAETYTADKQRYKALLWLNKAAESNAASELANRTVSLTDNIWGSAVTAGTLTRLLAGDVGALGSMALATFAGVGAGALNKYLRQQGQGLAARTGEKVLAIMRASESTQRATDGAVSRFFASADTREPIAPLIAAQVGEQLAPLRERFDKKLERFEQFAQAPEARLSRALGDTDQTAPAVASEVRAGAMRAAAFLQSKAPTKRVRASDAQAHLDKTQRVADSEMARWLRYAAAVENPKQVIKDFGNGTVTREGAEVLRTCYPRMHEQLVASVQQKLATAKERLPRQRLVQLSLLLGKPLHPSMEPEFIAMCQAVHAAGRQPKQSGLSPGQQRAPNSAAAYATASQQLEANR